MTIDSDAQTQTESRSNALIRRAAFAESIDPSLRHKEDNASRLIGSLNASRLSKMRKLHDLAEQLTRDADRFVACRKGCAACCHMNVTISATEAALIERAADRKSSAPALSRAHDPKRFVGTPCPFLKESACTIYSARPLACRMHLSFDTSAYWCQPERMHLAEMPMLRFEGLVDAYFTLIGSDVTADIRDFFPGR